MMKIMKPSNIELSLAKNIYIGSIRIREEAGLIFCLRGRYIVFKSNLIINLVLKFRL